MLISAEKKIKQSENARVNAASDAKPLVRNHWKLILGLALTLPVFAQQVQQVRQRADMSRFVVVGDSLSAGFQNFSLLSTQQVHGYANLIATQKGVWFPLPLIAYPGVPNVLRLVRPGPPPIVEPVPGTSIGRLNPLIIPSDLAVPGHKVQDVLTTRPNLPVDSLTDLVLGVPGLLLGVSKSQVEWAELMRPTTILLWIGNNDALAAITDAGVTHADPTFLTPVPQFQSAFHQLITRLVATRATLVVANIPDVTAVPFLTPAEAVAALFHVPLSELGLSPGDSVTPEGVQIAATNPHSILPPQYVLTLSEAITVRAAVQDFNAVIQQEAAAVGATLVDIHALVAGMQANGINVDKLHLTTDFLGGLFSLDGVHPTNTGYAVIANEFIRVMNAKLAANIPEVKLAKVAHDDPLIFSKAK